MGPGNQIGAATVGVNTKLPAGEVLPVLRGLGQAETAGLGNAFQPEVAGQTSAGGPGQRNGGLVAGARHIPDVIGGTGGGGDVSCGLEHAGFGNVPGLGDVQGVPALSKGSAVPVGEGEPGQDAVGIQDTGILSGQGNHRGAAAVHAGEAGEQICRSDAGFQAAVGRSEAGHAGGTRIVENIPGGAALICGITDKAVGVPQTAYNLINEHLGGNPQRNIGIVGVGGGGHADGLVPHLVTVQQNLTNGLPTSDGERIPDIASRRSSAALHGHAPVNGVAGGTGGEIPVGFQAVQRIIGIWHSAIPGKMPAHILDVGSLYRAVTIELIGAGHLVIQPGGVVAVVRVVEQQDAALAAVHGEKGDAVHFQKFITLNGVSFLCRNGSFLSGDDGFLRGSNHFLRRGGFFCGCFHSQIRTACFLRGSVRRVC